MTAIIEVFRQNLSDVFFRLTFSFRTRATTATKYFFENSNIIELCVLCFDCIAIIVASYVLTKDMFRTILKVIAV